MVSQSHEQVGAARNNPQLQFVIYEVYPFDVVL